MIEDPDDPHRGRRGCHHDRHGPGPGGSRIDAIDGVIARIVTSHADRDCAVAWHLARALPCELISLPAASVPFDQELHLLAAARAADLVAATVDANEIALVCRAVRRHAQATARPWLAVPPGVRPDVGLRVVALQDASHPAACRLAAACLRDALPLLRDAERIDLLCLDDDRFGRSFLEEHGCVVGAEAFDGARPDPAWPDLLLVGFSPEDHRAREATRYLQQAMRSGASALFSS